MAGPIDWDALEAQLAAPPQASADAPAPDDGGGREFTLEADAPAPAPAPAPQGDWKTTTTPSTTVDGSPQAAGPIDWDALEAQYAQPPAAQPSGAPEAQTPATQQPAAQTPAAQQPAAQTPATQQPGTATPGQDDETSALLGILKGHKDQGVSAGIRAAVHQAKSDPMFWLNPMPTIASYFRARGAEVDPLGPVKSIPGMAEDISDIMHRAQAGYEDSPDGHMQRTKDFLSVAPYFIGSSPAPLMGKIAPATTVLKEPGVISRSLDTEKQAGALVRDAARKDTAARADAALADPMVGQPTPAAGGQPALGSTPPGAPPAPSVPYTPAAPSTSKLNPDQLAAQFRTREAAAEGEGQDLRVMDTGGAATKGLVRDVTNISPDAQSTIENVVNPRYAQQSERIGNWMQENMGVRTSNYQVLKEMKEAADAAQAPAYKRAYETGDRPLQTPELERLAGAPSVVEAMKTAAKNGKDRAILDGMGAFNPGVTFGDGGIVNFNKGPSGVPTYPNLQMWDYTKRELDNMAGEAFSKGRTSQGADLSKLSERLRNELDKEVPEYADARGVAANFFGSKDAVEAGEAAVHGKWDADELADVKKKMDPDEAMLFEQGYLNGLLKDVRFAKDRDNLSTRFANSEGERAKMASVLDPKRAREFEAMLHSENLIDQARQGLGNSTSARQLHQLLHFGSGNTGIVSHSVAAGVASAAFFGGIPGLITAGLTWGAGKATMAYRVKVANHVARMLASDDPQVFNIGVKRASSEGYLDSLRKFVSSSDADKVAAVTKMLAASDESSGSPTEGARQAADGNWYKPDPERPGKYLQVHY